MVGLGFRLRLARKECVDLKPGRNLNEHKLKLFEVECKNLMTNISRETARILERYCGALKIGPWKKRSASESLVHGKRPFVESR